MRRSFGRRTWWAGSVAILLGLTGTAIPASAAPARAGITFASTPPGFVATAPQRIVDTRIGVGAAGPILAGQTLSVTLPAIVPVDALGVALTVTADRTAVPGFVTAYPCGGSRPLASLLNPQPAEARSNQLLLDLDATRQACLYANVDVHVIVDLTGWLSGSGDGYHAVPQFRALDTRTGPRPDGGVGRPAAGAVLEIPLAGANGVAANATAVAANITMTNAEADGFVTAYPCGSPTPPTSTGNARAGETRASFTFVGIGSGSLCLFTLEPADLVVDVTGYFGPGAGTPVYPATPRRVLDTRFDSGGKLAAGESRIVRLGLPNGTTAATMNVTATDADAPGWVRLSPCGTDPGTSSVNYDTSNAIANLASTTVGSGEDSVCITSNVSTHVVIDVAAASTQGTVAALEVTGATLFPAFRPDILDYVLRCPSAGSNAITVHLAGEAGASAQLDNSAAAPSINSTFALEPGQAFSAAFAGPGGSATYRVRCLPPDFPSFTSRRVGQPASGWYLVTPPMDAGGGSYVTIFDREGVPVWWYRESTPTADAKLLANPTRLVWAGANGQPYNFDTSLNYKAHTLDGTVTDQVSAVGTATDYHDMAFLADGNRLVTTYVPRLHVDLSPIGEGTDQGVLDAHIQEVTPGGTVVWEWRSEDHIAVAETMEFNRFAFPILGMMVDLLHVNAISEDGDGIIVSARHLDAVFRIDKATGNLTWKLGGAPHTLSPGVKNLAFVNDPRASLILQHDARVLPDGTLTVHDNRSFATGQARAVRYQLNLAAGTATMLEQIVNPEVTLSFFQGSARRTAAATWVVDWGGSTITTEQDLAGNLLFELRFAHAISYRGVPIMPNELSRDALASGMAAQHPR